MRFSDVTTMERLHELEIYAEVYQKVGIEHQIAFTLPSAPDRILGVVLCREKLDFSDTERDLLNAARPFLIQAYRSALRYRALLVAKPSFHRREPAPEVGALLGLGLTMRQATVLQLLSIGTADRDIATHLQISLRTVHKHVENCYRLLGVNSRAEAAAVAWAAAQAPAQSKRVHRPAPQPAD